MPFSQIIPHPTESKRLLYTSVTLLLSRIQGCHYHLSKFHIYAAYKRLTWDLPDSALDKNLSASAGDSGLIPGLGRFHMPHRN